MPKRFEALDAFRGLAALCVVMFHLKLLQNSVANIAFFADSFLFVDFFFMLSGFVLAHAYGYKNKVDFKKFALSRFFRLYPLHLFMLIVICLLEFGKMFATDILGLDFRAAAFTGRSALSELIPNLLLIQAWFPQFNSASFNSVAWSISVEFYTYFIFIATVLFCAKYKEFFWLGISLFAFVCLAFNLDILQPNVESGLAKFFLGALIYTFRLKFKDLKPNGHFWSYVEGFVLAITILTIGFITDQNLKNPLIYISFTLLIFIFSYDKGKFSQLLCSRPLQYIGALSYSIYMLNLTLIFLLINGARILQKIVGQEFTFVIDNNIYLNFGNDVINNIIVVLMLICTLVASHFTYKYIELKFTYQSVMKWKETD